MLCSFVINWSRNTLTHQLSPSISRSCNSCVYTAGHGNHQHHSYHGYRQQCHHQNYPTCLRRSSHEWRKVRQCYPKSYSIPTNAQYGQCLVVNPKKVVYISNPNYNGIDWCKYMACVDMGICDSVWIIVNIMGTPCNKPSTQMTAKPTTWDHYCTIS